MDHLSLPDSANTPDVLWLKSHNLDSSLALSSEDVCDGIHHVIIANTEVRLLRRGMLAPSDTPRVFLFCEDTQTRGALITRMDAGDLGLAPREGQQVITSKVQNRVYFDPDYTVLPE